MKKYILNHDLIKHSLNFLNKKDLKNKICQRIAEKESFPTISLYHSFEGLFSNINCFGLRNDYFKLILFLVIE